MLDISAACRHAEYGGLGAFARRPGRERQKQRKFKKAALFPLPGMRESFVFNREQNAFLLRKKLELLVPQPANAAHTLSVASSDGDWYVTAEHEMTRAHFISFVALLTGDTLFLKKCYPEWGLGARTARFFGIARGTGCLQRRCDIAKTALCRLAKGRFLYIARSGKL